MDIFKGIAERAAGVPERLADAVRGFDPEDAKDAVLSVPGKIIGARREAKILAGAGIAAAVIVISLARMALSGAKADPAELLGNAKDGWEGAGAYEASLTLRKGKKAAAGSYEVSEEKDGSTWHYEGKAGGKDAEGYVESSDESCYVFRKDGRQWKMEKRKKTSSMDDPETRFIESDGSYGADGVDWEAFGSLKAEKTDDGYRLSGTTTLYNAACMAYGASFANIMGQDYAPAMMAAAGRRKAVSFAMEFDFQKQLESASFEGTDALAEALEAGGSEITGMEAGFKVTGRGQEDVPLPKQAQDMIRKE